MTFVTEPAGCHGSPKETPHTPILLLLLGFVYTVLGMASALAFRSAYLRGKGGSFVLLSFYGYISYCFLNYFGHVGNLACFLVVEGYIAVLVATYCDGKPWEHVSPLSVNE
jgi:hypothetical protein